MSRLLKILGLQIEPDLNDRQINLDKVESLLEKHVFFKPELIVLSEVFNMGILPPEMVKERAETIPGPTYQKLSTWAKTMECYLLGGSIIERCSDGQCRNNSMLFGPDGNMLANYYKIHMFNYYGSQEGKFCTGGNETVLVDTPIAKIGMSVCFDLRFTELYRLLATNGAEIIVVPAAWPYPRLDHWVTLNKARAIENSCFIIAVNQVGAVPPSRINAGNSMIIDPWGCIVAGCGEKETVMMAQIDLNEVTKLRQEFPLLKDRKMQTYSNIRIVEVTKR